MTEEQFWDIVAQTLRFKDDAAKQAKALENVLGALPDDDIVGFDTLFVAQKHRAFRWDLWGAAFVIHGGASDDAFDYFRSWLIAQGKDAFEQALADPDSLADLIAPGRIMPLENEAFGQIAGKLWHHQTGLRFGRLPSDRLSEDTDGPDGEPFEEDDETLARCYPKLWAMFGQTPLG
ncbi:MAG TPA: DUF4240 domain-containing protein [Rhizomicrobium sp.]|nr:DUF4240 domain-containing protein [Rhizomicrobium sp.]